MGSARVLIVDDEVSMREFLEILLIDQGYAVDSANCGQRAVEMVGEAHPAYDIVVTDLKMPNGDGLLVLNEVKRIAPNTEVVVMTAFSTTETAVEAMRAGAYDYLSKPFKVDEITVVLEKCLEKRRLNQENSRLRSELLDKYQFGNIIGRSVAIRRVFDVIAQVAPVRTSVLLFGETGTGKELVAKALHYNSPRRTAPFVVVNCGAIPEQLIESELFGHVRGSFTGAVADKKGLFAQADGGSVFLDEIGELSLSLQVTLLRVLQERSIKRVGGLREEPVDVRIIAATHRDLEEEVREGRFRQDLFYRLNVIQLEIPPLRNRREDIPYIAQHFVEKFSEELAKKVRGITPEAMDLLLAHDYPGNVRELENIVERSVTFERTDFLTVESLPPQLSRTQQPVLPGSSIELSDKGIELEALLAETERHYLVEALRMTGGVRTEAARLLGMSFRSIRYKLSKYGIDVEELEL